MLFFIWKWTRKYKKESMLTDFASCNITIDTKNF